ncbi:MAG: STAS domain-containing protein [Halothiobacillaceae bacterium]
MQIQDEFNDDILTVRPEGRLDSNTAPDFEQYLLGKLVDHPRVVIDFTGVDYVSSAGLRVLLMGAKRVRQGQGQLALCGLQDAIRQVFEISGFLSILEVCDDCAQATERVSAA